jgi:hypothetical protein
MTIGKIISLRVRPLRSADLSFNIPGILAIRSDKASLMTRIQETLNYQQDVYGKLGDSDNQGSLLLNADKIRSILQPYFLYQLQNETASASLDQMILQRQNAFLERYQFNQERLEQIEKLFPVSARDLTGEKSAGSKLDRLRKQREADVKRYTELKDAYEVVQPLDGIDRNGVVTQQKTDTSNSILYTDGHTINTVTRSKPINAVTPEHKAKVISLKADGTDDKPLSAMISTEVISKQTDSSGNPLPEDYLSQKTDTTYPEGKGTKLDQKNTVFYSEFLHPSQDNIVRHERLQSDLMQEELSDALYAFRVNNLLDIWRNELKALDLEVQKFQVSFIRTFLFSPFPGVVTAVYKDVGESVQAGEPVIRIEDNRKLLLVGIINFRDLLRIGDTITITTNDLFENNVRLTISDAVIVSIRGHDSDNDAWDVILQCDNPEGADRQPVLPINYSFDRDNVVITKP